MKQTKVLYLRGLNTYGDDLQRIGFLKFGAMAGPLRQSLQTLDWDLVAIENIGSGKIEWQIERAYQAIISLPLFKSGEPFHLLGHSMGGLIMRALLHREEIRGRILSAVSIASPHHGAEAATVALGLADSHPLLNRFAAWMNYDTSHRSDSFQSLTPLALQSFNKKFPHDPDHRFASITCSIDPEWMSLPYRGLQVCFPKTVIFPGDGMISLATQSWGTHLGQFALDHLMEIGYCLDFRPKIRHHFQAEFRRMLNELSRFWGKTDSERT